MRIVGSILTLLYFSTAIQLVEFLQRSYSRDIDADRNDAVEQQLALVRYRIEAIVTSEIFQANGLASFISVSPKSTPAQWLPLARDIQHKAVHLRNLGVAPDNIMRFVYPVEGNDKVLGLDFRQHPEQWRTVEIARTTQNIFIAGPLELVQGGMAIVARIPIFADPPFNSRYWGTCSVALDWHSILKDAGALDFPAGLQLAMRGTDGLGAKGAIFFGEAKVFEQPLRTETVHLVSGTWQLAIKQTTEASAASWLKANLVRLMGYTLTLVLFITLMLMVKAYRSAYRYSFEDVLTKIGNRRRAMQILQRLQRRGSHFCIFNIDLNDFKRINDSYGHAAGDALLVEVAQRLEHELRASDVVARIGGDEFLLILPRVSQPEEIHAVEAKIRERVCAPTFSWQGISLPLHLSLGHACFPEDASNIEALLHQADNAMYQDKLRHRQPLTS